jgi:DNA polymerase elongation subunit (family B)
MELEYEKDLERIYFGDSKKRYYGIERNTGKKYIRGLNIIRKDSPPFLKEKLNEITELIVTQQFTIQDLISLRYDIEKIPYTELAITKKFSKRFELYDKNQPQHLKAARFANEILGTSIDHKDIPYLFYIVSHCEEDLKPKDRNTAICLLDEHLHFIDERKDLFEIDYETYFKKQVLDQLKEFDQIEYVVNILKEYKENAEVIHSLSGNVQ